MRLRAIETLSIVLRCILAKNLAGWEVMVVFAGEINESDKVFMVSCAWVYMRDWDVDKGCSRRGSWR